jgi:hypothetical protein
MEKRNKPVPVEAVATFWAEGPSRSTKRVLLTVARRADGVVFARWTGKGRGGFRSAPWGVVDSSDGWTRRAGVSVRDGELERRLSAPEARTEEALSSVRLPKLTVSVCVGVGA